MSDMAVSEANGLSVLSLAFVGDAVFSLYVRERLAKTYDFKSGKLSGLAVNFVSAPAQSKMYTLLLPTLNEDEAALIKRGRNAHTQSKAKNANLADYKKATALEALLGYLHLSGQKDRLCEIMEFCYGVIDLKDFK